MTNSPVQLLGPVDDPLGALPFLREDRFDLFFVLFSSTSFDASFAFRAGRGRYVSAAVRAKALAPDDCAQLDKSGLRSALGVLGLPTSGKLEAMRTRLQRALMVADADDTDQ